MTTAEVRAVRAGAKTQVRRLVKAKTPRAMPGDRLWVREHFALEGEALIYRGDDPKRRATHWRAPHLMTRAQSRLVLRVTAVKEERLTYIGERDCFAEGLRSIDLPGSPPAIAQVFPDFEAFWLGAAHCPFFATVRDAFAAMWDGRLPYGPSFASGPLVWALTFELELSPALRAALARGADVIDGERAA